MCYLCCGMKINVNQCSILLECVFYLWYSQSQGDAPQQEKVTVDPVHQFVNAAVCMDVLASLRKLQFLHAPPTHGVDNPLARWTIKVSTKC